MINFPSRTATCKNHVVPSKGIGNMDAQGGERQRDEEKSKDGLTD